MPPEHAETDADLSPKIEYVNRYGPHRSRARLLAEIEGLPDDAYITAKHAAAYLDTTVGQLANWRMKRSGPPFVRGKARYVRYRISDLKTFMQERIKATAP